MKVVLFFLALFFYSNDNLITNISGDKITLLGKEFTFGTNLNDIINHIPDKDYMYTDDTTFANIKFDILVSNEFQILFHFYESRLYIIEIICPEDGDCEDEDSYLKQAKVAGRKYLKEIEHNEEEEIYESEHLFGDDSHGFTDNTGEKYTSFRFISKAIYNEIKTKHPKYKISHNLHY